MGTVTNGSVMDAPEYKMLSRKDCYQRDMLWFPSGMTVPFGPVSLFPLAPSEDPFPEFRE